VSIDLAAVTKETFDAHLGSRFVLRLADGVLELDLIETQPLPTRPHAPRAGFLLRFRSATRGYLPQQIYRLEHAVLGALEIFLVPAEPDAVGARYDAVFS
jgi:hypothetical protein